VVSRSRLEKPPSPGRARSRTALRTRHPAWIAAVALALAVGAPNPAGATPETLKRSVGNILLAPVDLVLQPFVVGQTMYRNMRNIDDSLPVKIAYPIPGYIFTLGVHTGACLIRELAGLLEFLPGLGLAFFDADLDPLYDPVERSDALVEQETPVINFKVGINYTTGSD
jgi:hypothetical protein